MICQNSWGMKKIFDIENKQILAHLVCLYFSNDFYCENFSQQIYRPLKSIQNL